MHEPETLMADRARKDSGKRGAVNKAVSAEVARLAAMMDRMPKVMTDADYAAMADYQARADSVYTAFGERAPAPMQSETPEAYRIRLAKGMQQHSAAWRGIKLANLPSNALEIAENAIYTDAVAAARNPDGMEPGTLREIKKRDESGRMITEFVGDPSAWMAEHRTAPRSIARPFFRRNPIL